MMLKSLPVFIAAFVPIAVLVAVVSRPKRRWVCAVSKQEGKRGFLITACPTNAIKEGERKWPK